MDLEDMLYLLNPLSIIVIVITGIIIGYLYSKVFRIDFKFFYHSIVLVVSFYTGFVLSRIHLGSLTWERPLGIILLYILFMTIIYLVNRIGGKDE